MTYLYRATTNVCLNALRARAVREPGDAVETDEPSATTHDAVEARELVRQLLGRIDDRGLQIAALCYVDGLGQEEIGEVLGLSRKTIGRELVAIRALAEGLAHEGARP